MSDILLIEDNPGDARLIETLLAEADPEFALAWADTLSDGLRRLSDHEPAAVLLDLNLPDSNGLATLTTVRRVAPRLPVVLLTGLDDEQLAMRAMREGAQDYLVKGSVDGSSIARTLRYSIERNVIEQALRDSEEKLRLAMEASETGIWDFDLTSGKVTASPECQAMLGFEPVEVTSTIDEAWASRIHPDDRAASLRALQDTLSGRATGYERDHRLRAHDGSWLWVHGKGRVVERDENGQPLRVVLTRTNITARKAAEEAAVENARKFEQQHRIATMLQENFIHPLPEVAGLDLGRVGQPAYKPSLVGGDFSDVFVLDRYRIAILIGDVAGKGIRAAGLTETVRSTVRAFAMVDASPAFVLRKTNQLLRHEPSVDAVTAFFLVLDPTSGRADFAVAGHPDAILLRRGRPSWLEAPHGLPLGPFDRDYVDGHTVLEPSDRVVFYTDGLTEARRADKQFFGEERLLETVAGLQAATAQELAEGLRKAASDFAGDLKDDLEVLVLRLE